MLTTSNGRSPVRVMVVDDHPIVRMGLVRLLGSEPGLQVVAEAAEARQAMAFVRSHAIQFVVTDLTLNGISGLELIKQVHQAVPSMPILVFSMHDEAVYGGRALRAGARGYVMKSLGPDQLLQAVRVVLKGQICLSRNLAAQLMRKATDDPKPVPRSALGLLSDRELEVFELVGRGVTTRMIAARLCVSGKTIESHRENIKRKLSLHNATELGSQAARWVAHNDAEMKNMQPTG